MVPKVNSVAAAKLASAPIEHRHSIDFRPRETVLSLFLPRNDACRRWDTVCDAKLFGRNECRAVSTALFTLTSCHITMQVEQHLTLQSSEVVYMRGIDQQQQVRSQPEFSEKIHSRQPTQAMGCGPRFCRLDRTCGADCTRLLHCFGQRMQAQQPPSRMVPQQLAETCEMAEEQPTSRTKTRPGAEVVKLM